MTIPGNYARVGSLESASYLESGVSDISSNSVDPFYILSGMETFGLDDFEDSLFTPSTEIFGFSGLESSGSTINMKSIPDSEDRWSSISRQCSSQLSYNGWTSLPEGINLQQFSSNENYDPVADHTYTSNKNVQNLRRTFQNMEPASEQSNVVLKDIARRSKRKCSMLITHGQNEGQYTSGSASKVSNIVYQGGQASPQEVSWASSRNVAAERKRRRIANELLMTLRAMVPNISKMDKASIVSDAIDYIQSLQNRIKKTEVDISVLQSNIVQYSGSSTRQLILSSKIESVDLDHHGKQLTKSHAQQGFKIMELDVTKVEETTFLIRISCKKERGIIAQLIRAIESFELDIINASHATVNACILSTVLAEVEEWRSMEENQMKKIIVEAVSEFGFQASF